MKRALLLTLVAAVTTSQAQAQRASITPWMTGERLVKLLGNIDPASVDWSPDSPFRSRAIASDYLDMANRKFVHGYIEAVHDATEGKAWCWSETKPKPHELQADAIHALQRMSDAQLKRNAADLIVEVWSKSAACTHDQRRKK